MSSTPNPALYQLNRALSRDLVIAELEAMPGRLRRALHGKGDALLTRRASGEDWSAFQTLCHMRDATLVYAARFRWIVFDDDPLLPNYNENNWVAASMDVPSDVPAILDEIAASRADLVRVLSRLPEAGWLRTGRHEVAGTVVLEHYARHQVAHEEMHLAQIEAALA